MVLHSIIKKSVFVSCFIGIIIVSTSCHKYGEEPIAETQLIVAFSSAGIDIANTDSMVTVFTNGADTLYKKGNRAGSFYSIPLNEMPAGTYQALTKVYAAKDTSGNRRMFRYESNVNTQTGSKLTSPTGKQYDVWKASLCFYNQDNNIRFAIAERPFDPYFEFSLPSSLPYKNVYIERFVYVVSNKVKYAVGFDNTFFKAAGFKGFHSNQKAFQSFATEAAKLPAYSSADFSFQLYNETSNDYKVLFKQEVPYTPF